MDKINLRTRQYGRDNFFQEKKHDKYGNKNETTFIKKYKNHKKTSIKNVKRQQNKYFTKTRFLKKRKKKVRNDVECCHTTMIIKVRCSSDRAISSKLHLRTVPQNFELEFLSEYWSHDYKTFCV